MCRYVVFLLQDTNTLQYRLVRLLSSVHGNVFVVGDPFQCIYTWRFASPDNLPRLTTDYPVHEVWGKARMGAIVMVGTLDVPWNLRTATFIFKANPKSLLLLSLFLLLLSLSLLSETPSLSSRTLPPLGWYVVVMCWTRL